MKRVYIKKTFVDSLNSWAFYDTLMVEKIKSLLFYFPRNQSHSFLLVSDMSQHRISLLRPETIRLETNFFKLNESENFKYTFQFSGFVLFELKFNDNTTNFCKSKK